MPQASFDFIAPAVSGNGTPAPGGLLNKFAAVTVSARSALSPADVRQLEAYQQKYVNTRDLAFATLEIIKAANAQIQAHPLYSESEEGETRRCRKDLYFNADLRGKIGDIENMLIETNTDFIGDVERYLQKTYNLSVSFRRREFAKEPPQEPRLWRLDDRKEYLEKLEAHRPLKAAWEKERFEFLTRELNYGEIVDDLLEQSGGNFADRGINELIRSFNQKVGFYWQGWSRYRNEEKAGQSRAELQNKTVSLNSYFYMNYDKWDKTTKLSYSDYYNDGKDGSKFWVLIRALNYFFDGTISDHDQYFYLNDRQSVSFTSDYGNSNIAIRLYKNGKVSLKFNSAKEAERFYNTFEFYKKEERS